MVELNPGPSSEVVVVSVEPDVVEPSSDVVDVSVEPDVDPSSEASVTSEVDPVSNDDVVTVS